MSSLSISELFLLKAPGLRLVKRAWQWLETRRSRIALSQLDDRLLDDVGITRNQVEHETQRFSLFR